MEKERKLIKFLYENEIIEGEKLVFQCLKWLRDNKSYTKKDALETIDIIFKEE